MSDKLLFADLSQAQSDAIKGGMGPTETPGPKGPTGTGSDGPTQGDVLQVGGNIELFNDANNNFTNSFPVINFGKLFGFGS